MGSIVNIIEVIYGKYKLNEEVLRSVISSAQECDRIALISVIGSKFSGKSFLINCLLNYMESNERNSWPKRCSINCNYGFKNDYKNTNPVIQLYSKPLILEDENERIAIFLMDSSYVFTDMLEISKTKLMEDIIGLFMLTSSTVIYTKRFDFRFKDLKQLQECLAKNLDFIKSVDSFKELFFYIEDWDLKYERGDHLFGLKGGKDYINNESKGLELQNFFSNIECCLMPDSGKRITKTDLNFSQLNDKFIFELSKMVKMKLLNMNKMQIKLKSKTDEPIKANELIELFESYINRLNADSNVDMNIMDSTVNIVEVIDNKYELKEDVLRSVISLAENCDTIALISIFGPKFEGKTFLVNCLINYLESNEKNVWPKCKNSIIRWNYGFQNDYNNTDKAVIKMWPKPFVLKDENQSIAIFLMDSNHVFSNFSEITSSKLIRNMIAFFMNTSSTVIFNTSCRYLMRMHNERLQKLITNSFNFIKSIKSSSELILLIRDWDLKFGNKYHKTGLIGGKEYMSNELIELELNNYWRNIECYLIPSPESDVRLIDCDLSQLNDQFIQELSQFIKTKLLNMNEMQIKNTLESNQPIKANEFIKLFKTYINKLNTDSNETNDNKTPEERQSDETTDVNSCLVNKIVEKQKSYELNTQQSCDQNDEKTHSRKAKHGLKERKSEDSSHFSINESSSESNETKIPKNENNFNVSEQVVCVKVSDKIKQLKNSINITDNDICVHSSSTGSRTFVVSDLNRIPGTAHKHQSKQTSVSEMALQDFLSQYKIYAKIALDNKNLGFVNFISELNNIKINIMCSFDDHFKVKGPENANHEIIVNRNHLSSLIDVEKEGFEIQMKMKLEKQYELVVKNAVEYFNYEMKSVLNLRLKNLQFGSFDEKHKSIVEKSVNKFNEDSKFLYNSSIKTEFKNKLNNTLIKEKNKYSIIFNCLKTYNSNFESEFDKNRYFSDKTIEDFHSETLNEYKSSVEKYDDQKITDTLIDFLNKFFVLFKKRNEEIRKCEKEIAEKAINLAVVLYRDCLNEHLKSGLFTQNEVKLIHQTLLEHTLKSLKNSCDFNDHLQNDIQNEIKVIFETISAKYRIKFMDTISFLKKIKDEALKEYLSGMRKALQSKKYLKESEFEKSDKRIVDKVLNAHNKKLETMEKEFTNEYFQVIISENICDILEDIKTRREQYKEQNALKASKTSLIAIYFGHHYLIYATHEKIFEYIKDNSGQHLRSKTICFSDENLFTSVIEKERSINSSKKPFDIKRLISRTRSNVTEEDLNSYPFVFIGDELRVMLNNKFIENQTLSIEGLIALQVSSIKSDAEKQLGTAVSKAVLTIPTYYNIRQRNAFRDVAKIADLDSVHILSEMSAIAIGYKFHKQRLNTNGNIKILIVLVNEFECEIGICFIDDQKIQLKAYTHQKMKLNNTKVLNFSKSKHSHSMTTRDKNLKENEIRYKNYTELIDSTLNSIRLNFSILNDFMIDGSSELTTYIRIWILNRFDPKLSSNCDPLDLTIKGSAIYSQMLAKKLEIIEISEVTVSPILCRIEAQHISEEIKLFEKNAQSGQKIEIKFDKTPEKYSLPFKISLIQNDIVIKALRVDSLPQLKNRPKPWNNLSLQVVVKDFGELELGLEVSKLNLNIFSNPTIYNVDDYTDLRLELSDYEIERELKIVELLNEKLLEKKKINEEILNLRQDLERYCAKVKKSVDSNSDLFGPIKKKINEELIKTLSLINADCIDMKAIANQRKELEQKVESYL